MNMGGPGDHWYTDLFSWKRRTFGEPVDTLIREIGALGGGGLLLEHSFGAADQPRDDQSLDRRLSRAWRKADEGELRELATDLARIRDELRAEAIARGWEVD